jgi:F420H(2)-dependent quinone reductase
LVYARDGDDCLLVASSGGADRPPAWLHNLSAHPDVEIQVWRERRRGTTRIIEPSDRATSGCGGWSTRTRDHYTDY